MTEPSMKIPQPRAHHKFHEMGVDDLKKVHILESDPSAGERARCAAYAYGRRNKRQFCGEVQVQRGKKYMVIRRVK